MDNGDITYADLLQSFYEFLIIFVHSVLYNRGLYPAVTFDDVTKYNIALYQNRHPMVRQYIHSIVDEVMDHVRSGSVNRISLVVINSQEVPLERYVIDISSFPQVPIEEQEYIIDDLEFTWNELMQQYRALLVKLFILSPSFGKMPSDCSYRLLMETQEQVPELWHHSSLWTLADYPSMSSSNDDNNSVPVWAVNSRPIRRVSAGVFSFNLWLEEGKTKGKLPE